MKIHFCLLSQYVYTHIFSLGRPSVLQTRYLCEREQVVVLIESVFILNNPSIQKLHHIMSVKMEMETPLSLSQTDRQTCLNCNTKKEVEHLRDTLS